MTTATQQLDDFDLKRLGLLLKAAQSLSDHGFVRFSYAEANQAWRVAVKVQHPAACRCLGDLGCIGIGEYVATAQHSELLALERAVTWLREARDTLMRETPARIPTLRCITNGPGR